MKSLVKFPSSSISRHLLRRLLLEWLAILLLTFGLLWLLADTRSLQLANFYAYDRVLSAHERMGDPDIVVVAIDEDSLAQLGHWPWRRTVHADFLNQLKLSHPRAVLFDVLFTESSQNQSDDLRLAKAMEEVPNLVSPFLLIPSSQTDSAGSFEIIPPVVRGKGLGHIAVNSDSDGVVRRIQLRYRNDQEIFDAAGVKLLQLGEPLFSQKIIEQKVQTFTAKQQNFDIPLNVPKGGYQTVSYRSVLDGEVPAEFLRDKYVLVGVTALGLGDQFTTPISGIDGTVPGVEIHANLIDALKNGWSIVTLHKGWSAVPVILLMIGFLLVKERFHLWTFMVILAAFLSTVLWLMWSFYIWLPPVLGALGMLWVYLLWSWRRLALVVRYAQTEWQGVQNSAGNLLPLLSPQPKSHFLPHSIELGMDYTHRLHNLVSNSLEHLPSGLLVIDTTGYIRLCNEEMQRIFDKAELHVQLEPASSLQSILTMLDPNVQAWTQWQDASDFDWLNGIEISGSAGVFKLHAVPIRYETADNVNVWLVNFIELTAERFAQRERSNLVKFLSHDLRTPQVAILAVLDLHPNTAPIVKHEITHQVRRTLNWANELVYLTQAQNDDLKLSEVNLADVAQEAVDEVFWLAEAKKIRLQHEPISEELYGAMWLVADKKLIYRAVVNLLTNAIRYSNDGMAVILSLAIDLDHLVLYVKDQGVGISKQQLEALRGDSLQWPQKKENQLDAAGSLGVGLSMVYAVMRRHNGRLDIESVLGSGSSFSLHFPKNTE